MILDADRRKKNPPRSTADPFLRNQRSSKHDRGIPYDNDLAEYSRDPDTIANRQDRDEIRAEHVVKTRGNAAIHYPRFNYYCKPE